MITLSKFSHFNYNLTSIGDLANIKMIQAAKMGMLNIKIVLLIPSFLITIPDKIDEQAPPNPINDTIHANSLVEIGNS